MGMSNGNEQAARATGTQTLERGLDLLDLVVREPMRASRLAEASNLTRSTTNRLVHCLVDRGLLIVAEDGQLRPGPTLLQLGALAQSRCDLHASARTHLEALSARTGLCAFLGRRDGDFSVHLHRTPGVQKVLVGTPVGTRRALAETSLGKALLLDDDRTTWKRLFEASEAATDWAAWEAEMRRNVAEGVVLHEAPPPDRIRAVAAPIRDASGRIVGAISVASAAHYLDDAAMAELAPLVRGTGEKISAEFGWTKPGR
jgi:DNA-binding IclR family transcriptional regulator